MNVLITVGHSILRNGNCTSASGYVNEYRYNKALVYYLQKELQALGINTDVCICPEYVFNNRWQEKAYKLPICNNGKYDLICELHLNSSNGQGHGTEVFYYAGDSNGCNYATRVCKNFEKLGFKNRGAKGTRNLYMISETHPTAILIESFFCDNRSDCNLADNKGYKKIAEAIGSGIANKNVKAFTGWKKENGKWFYYKDNKKHIGWLEYNKKWYYFNNNGEMITGWLEYNKHWFYFNQPNGDMLTGWLEYNGHKFYFDKNGFMVTGEHSIGNKKYKFNKDGYLI